MSDPRIKVGYVQRAHGIRGEVIVRSLSDDPGRFDIHSEFLSDEEPPRRFEITRSRPHPDGYLVTFDGIIDRNRAETLRGISLTIAAAARRGLGDDEFWPDDLVGLHAVRPDGSRLGTISDVVLGKAQDRLVVKTPDGTEVQIPFVAAIVGDIDLHDGTIVTDPPEGLFPSAGE